MKRTTFSSLIILSIILLSATVAFSQGIKERMKERLPDIVELKNNDIIGENDLGYLEFVGNKKEKEDIVKAENNDRKKVYEAIARKQKATADIVGKRRAQQIAEKSNPGNWLKGENGKWYQKK